MSAHTLSMSKVHLALACAHSFRPDVAVPLKPTSMAARKGTAVHLLVECWFHDLVPDKQTGFEVLPDDTAKEVKRIAEQAIGWLSPRRGRVLKCEAGLRYDAEADKAEWGPRRGEPGYDEHGAMVLPGTLDLVLRGADGVLEVVDIKTGKRENMHEEQLRAQGLAVSRIYGESVVRVGFLRPLLTKCDEPEWITLRDGDLDEVAGETYGLLRRLPISEAQWGDHCNRCDYRPACPAYSETHTEQTAAELEAAGFFA